MAWSNGECGYSWADNNSMVVYCSLAYGNWESLKDYIWIQAVRFSQLSTEELTKIAIMGS